MWFVYILRSLKDGRTYTGSTDNLERRLREHNNGLVTATKNRRPLKYMYREIYKTELEAREKERYYKTAAGRRKIKIIFQNLGQ